MKATALKTKDIKSWGGRMKETSLAVFEGKQIRRYYDGNTETWYFSVARSGVKSLSLNLERMLRRRKEEHADTR
jgi:hypothetical protein